MSESESKALMKAPVAPEVQAMLMERKAANEVSRQVANMSWGKSLDHLAVRALTEYCRRHRIDPAREIDVLGGRIYLNANYFIRRLAEMQRQGRIREVAEPLHFNADDRLAKLAARGVAGAQELADTREMLRVKHNVPEGAKGACLIRITTTDGVTVEGVGYAGVGRDPVGESAPGKTAETRAFRRAGRLLVETVPALSGELEALREDGEVVAEVLKEHTTTPHQIQNVATDYAREEEAPRLTKAVVSEALDLYEEDAA